MNNKIAIISSMNDKRTPYNGIKIGGEETIYEKYNKKYLEKKMNPYGDSKKNIPLLTGVITLKVWEHVMILKVDVSWVLWLGFIIVY
jgi:hypothetical protein